MATNLTISTTIFRCLVIGLALFSTACGAASSQQAEPTDDEKPYNWQIFFFDPGDYETCFQQSTPTRANSQETTEGARTCLLPDYAKIKTEGGISDIRVRHCTDANDKLQGVLCIITINREGQGWTEAYSVIDFRDSSLIQERIPILRRGAIDPSPSAYLTPDGKYLIDRNGLGVYDIEQGKPLTQPLQTDGYYLSDLTTVRPDGTLAFKLLTAEGHEARRGKAYQAILDDILAAEGVDFPYEEAKPEGFDPRYTQAYIGAGDLALYPDFPWLQTWEREDLGHPFHCKVTPDGVLSACRLYARPNAQGETQGWILVDNATGVPLQHFPNIASRLRDTFWMWTGPAEEHPGYSW
ncbi:hypothetical protein CAI21_11555 [Alkalilimnicola ehrlichii]|uniref:Phytase-like domain-containing protein n=1 Tax=Alkalilimnicola ehrlichii TaxID=351052 RepID=A0A3E0WTF3_9GAMM|nr:hypothetical protein [Alkalilimnicola ehrlichii]RFA28504.1 hypothetical protein CAI21_11555 [Alkalilimnicola ehrlichii]RFA35669.1 hypothetical protein CAL65_12090 [Alkalilimnicola ehrlichii]